MVVPSGESATPQILPSLPASMGGLRVRSRRPLASSHTRTVLSCDPVTRYRLAASMPIREIPAVCMPVSRPRNGSVGGLPAGALVWLVAGPMYAAPTVSQTIRNVTLTAVESEYMTSSCLRDRLHARPFRTLWRVLDPSQEVGLWAEWWSKTTATDATSCYMEVVGCLSTRY